MLLVLWEIMYCRMPGKVEGHGEGAERRFHTRDVNKLGV
jgi:hypothetical protein